MHQVGVGLDSYTSAVVDARNHMPEPVYATADRYFREGYDVKADSGPSAAVLAEQLLDDHMPSQRQAQQAKAEAVRVMDRYEKASKGVRDRLPSFVDTPGADGGSGDPNFESPGTSGKGHDSTTAASAISSPGANPDLAGAGSGFPGGVAGSGSGAYAGPAGRTLGVGGMSATEMGGAAASAGAAGATGAAGARGTGLTSGFLPPGAGARHDDDHEHNNRYVKESGFDFLDDVPPAYPPVLGE
jgi:hypothetical protein